MNTQRDPDTVVPAWLDEGPTDLPDATRRAILTALPTISQARGGRLAAGRLFSMAGTARLAVVAVVAVIAAGGMFYLLGPSRYGSGGSPTPSQTMSPAPTTAAQASPNLLDTASWTPFTSTLNGFSARVPRDWTVTPAAKASDLASISARDPAVFDDAVAPATPLDIRALSTKLPLGMTADQWLAAYRQPIVDQSGDVCFPTRDKWQAVTVDGQTDGGVYRGCDWFRVPNQVPDNYTLSYVKAMFFVQGRVYIFQVNLGARGISTNETYELLRAFLSTVTFDAASAVDPLPSPS